MHLKSMHCHEIMATFSLPWLPRRENTLYLQHRNLDHYIVVSGRLLDIHGGLKFFFK